jgi:predicted nucleic acid-binding protein
LRLIDTNVVMYAAGKAHPLQDEARRVLDRIAEGVLHANVDAELLQEILHVYDARKERAKGFDTIDDLLVLFPNPIPIAREEIETARDLMRRVFFRRRSRRDPRGSRPDPRPRRNRHCR